MRANRAVHALTGERIANLFARMAATILCGITLQTAAHGAPRVETVETLTAKKVAIEADLAKVNALIERAISQASDRPDADTPKKYFVEDFGLWGVDSAGGVSVSMVIDNPNADVPLYNQVGDQLRSRIDSSTLRTLQFTGPLKAGEALEGREGKWGPLWYDSTGHCIKMVSVLVTYMNGKRQSFSGASLKNALSPRLTNDCRAGAKQYTDQ